MRGERGASAVQSRKAEVDLRSATAVAEPSPLARTSETIREQAEQAVEELARRRARRKVLAMIDQVLGDVERVLLLGQPEIPARALDRATTLARKLGQDPARIPMEPIDFQEMLFTWQHGLMRLGMPQEWIEFDPAEEA
ncbi:MAG: hypothetical protein ACYDAY_08930 [Candidatus Dormibacteria bacterium]